MQLAQGMIAVVTGAGSGMGEAVTRMLSNQGMTLVLLDKNAQTLEHVAYDTDAVAMPCDVSDAQAVEHVFEAINEMPGQMRVLVNCAGIAPAKRAVGRDGPMTLQEFTKVIEVNLIGTFNTIRLGAALMMNASDIAGERGIIINTASIAAYEGQIGQSAYSASKGGIVSMTLPLAREFANQGIRVNTIAPGLIATPLLLNMPQEVQDSLASTVPFPKRFGTVHEFSSLVSHIIDNTMINGEVIRLDGALRMREK